jgi:hypothetical protein
MICDFLILWMLVGQVWMTEDGHLVWCHAELRPARDKANRACMIALAANPLQTR